MCGLLGMQDSGMRESEFSLAMWGGGGRFLQMCDAIYVSRYDEQINLCLGVFEGNG